MIRSPKTSLGCRPFTLVPMPAISASYSLSQGTISASYSLSQGIGRETNMTSPAERTKQDWLLSIGLLCFCFSGAAGLIYEVVWTRMLTQIFGNTTYAIATVLSAFMAGVCFGGDWCLCCCGAAE